MHSAPRWIMGCLILGGRTTFATLPLNTDEADTQDPGTLQVEGGASYDGGCACRHVDIPLAVTYGVMPKCDIAAGFGQQFEKRTTEEGERERVSGLDDLNLAMKWMFLEESPFLPRQTLNPSVTFPTADDHKGLGSGKADCDLTWKASKSLGKDAGIHLNIGYTWVGEQPHEHIGNVLHCGLAADYQFLESLQGNGEIFESTDLREHETTWQYNAGFRWAIIDNLKLVAAAGSRITGDAPDFTATAGLIWVLGTGKPDNTQ